MLKVNKYLHIWIVWIFCYLNKFFSLKTVISIYFPFINVLILFTDIKNTINVTFSFSLYHQGFVKYLYICYFVSFTNHFYTRNNRSLFNLLTLTIPYERYRRQSRICFSSSLKVNNCQRSNDSEWGNLLRMFCPWICDNINVFFHSAWCSISRIDTFIRSQFCQKSWWQPHQTLETDLRLIQDIVFSLIGTL